VNPRTGFTKQQYDLLCAFQRMREATADLYINNLITDKERERIKKRFDAAHRRSGLTLEMVDRFRRQRGHI
jgi:hypothetical protein